MMVQHCFDLLSFCSKVIYWNFYLRKYFLLFSTDLNTLPQDSGVVLWYHVGLSDPLSVHPSVIHPLIHPSVHPYFHSQMITCVNYHGFSPNLICALILWRSGAIANGQISSIFDSYLPAT